MRRVRTPDCGFALTEVLVAMLIVGLTVPLVVGVVMASLKHARGSQDRGAATVWVAGEIEYLRRQCYNRLTPVERRAPALPGEPPLPALFAQGYVRVETCSAGTCPGYTAGDLFRISVSLSKSDWAGTGPPPHPVMSTVTYISDVRMGTACETSP